MPISIIELDSSTKEENITLILGKNILLKIIEDLEKQSLLKNNVVKKFISIPDLCHDDIRLLIEELMQKEDRITVPSSKKAFGSDGGYFPFEVASSLGDTSITVKLDEPLDKQISEKVQREFEKVDYDEIQNVLARAIYELTGKVDKKLIQTENKKMVSISDKIKKKTGFEILVPSNLLLCPKCEVILSTEEFRGSKKCYICNKNVTREDAERIYIHKVDDKVNKVWEKNLWFEAYMARLLRKLDCKTWTSVHVMGASGILHEVDVLAIRDGTVLICECKTGKVSRNNVFNFCTKAGDLKAHISILALIKELPEPETREFVKKNPAIIRLENMGKKKEVEILADLEQRLSIKG